MLDESGNNGFANDCRNRIFYAGLDYAGAECLRGSEQIAKVQVMREHHQAVGPSIFHNLGVIGFRMPTLDQWTLST